MDQFRSLELEIDGKLIKMMREGGQEIGRDVGERLLPELERIAIETNDSHKMLIFNDLQKQYQTLQDKQIFSIKPLKEESENDIYYSHESDRIYGGQRETEHIITMASQAREKLTQQGITMEAIKSKMNHLYRENVPRLKSIFRGVKMGQRRETVIFAIFCAFLIAILLWMMSPSKRS